MHFLDPHVSKMTLFKLLCAKHELQLVCINVAASMVCNSHIVRNKEYISPSMAIHMNGCTNKK